MYLQLSLNKHTGASLVAQMVERLSAMQETRIRSLGWEDPLEKEMAAHSSILAWRIPWKKELGRLQSKGLQRARHDWATKSQVAACIPQNWLHRTPKPSLLH